MSTAERLQQRAQELHRLHRQNRPLVLPNVWDAGSARLVEQAGASVIATSSAGVAWALGCRDGEGLEREQALGVIRSIVQAVNLPVTADVESGYGQGTPQDVATTVRGVLEAGAVGINLEDTPGRGGEPILAPEEQAERLRAARKAAQEAGVDLFVNARTDVFLRGLLEPEERLEEVLRRAQVYLEAGADGIFVPGVVDAPTIQALVEGLPAPLNLMVKPESPRIEELSRLGVARVSLGAGLALGALGHLRRSVEGLLRDGAYPFSDQDLTSAEANGLFGQD